MFVRCGAESHYGKGRIRSRSSSLSAVHREDLRYRTGRTHAAIHLDLKGNRLKRIVKRSNAQLSTGPKTPEGKKRSSLNAFRHGLTGQIVIHTPEDRAAFQQHCDAIREALAPVGALETDLAQAIAEDRWRLNRAGPSKMPSSPSAFRSTPTPTPPTPKSTPLSLKAALGSPRQKTSSSSRPTNSASAAPSKEHGRA